MMALIPQQNLAVDLLILSFDRLHNKVKIFTPIREDSHKKALPGILVKENESIEEAVHRTLNTKTNLSGLKYILQELPAQTNPHRDPRGQVVSIPILVLILESFSYGNGWSIFEKDLDLDFDHTEMVNKAFTILSNNWDKHPLPLLLAGDTITLEETRDLLAHFLPYYQKTLPSNLRRMSFVMNFLQETDEYDKNKQGRPPRLYKILKDKIKLLYR